MSPLALISPLRGAQCLSIPPSFGLNRRAGGFFYRQKLPDSETERSEVLPKWADLIIKGQMDGKIKVQRPMTASFLPVNRETLAFWQLFCRLLLELLKARCVTFSGIRWHEMEKKYMCC